MAIEPPFLYDHPSKYSFVGPTEKGFNPKAASQASWSPPRSRPAVNGPLINSKDFNKHPDSYFVVPYGNLNWKPMSPRTKSKVRWSRLVQLFLRILELLGAIGLLFCVICIKGTEDSTGWIIRIPPGIAILHTVYAIYHLSRAAKGRTPSSSASYMLFAAIIDAGLIPFLVFTALISHTEYIEPDNVTGHWSTLFGADKATTKITYSTFLTSVVSGSLHIVSLILSIYLGVVFRQISRLPPDMNPLEDNLTSRHKRNKSSIFSGDGTNKATAPSLTGKRGSQADDPLLSPPRSVPFIHTRNESRDSIADVSKFKSSPRESRASISTPFYDQPPAHRTSQTDMKGPVYRQAPLQRSSKMSILSMNDKQPDIPHFDEPKSHSGDLSQAPFYDQPPAHRSSQTDIKGPIYRQAPSQRSSKMNILSTDDNQPDFPQLIETKSHPGDLGSAPPSQVSPEELHRSSTKSSSIYSTSTIPTIATGRPAPTRPFSTAPSLPDSNWITHPSPSPSPSPPRELQHLRNKSSYQPLSQTSPFEYTANNENLLPKPLQMNPPTPPVQIQKRRQAMEHRALTPGSGNHGQGNWGMGPGTVGIGKARAWGELGKPRETVGAGRNTRVISRSGVDVGNAMLPSQGFRAREVSGKVMEEGRGGTGGWM